MIDSALNNMSSDNYALQIKGIDEGLVIMDAFFSKVVSILETAEDNLFIAERISNVYQSLREKLKVSFDNTNNIELKVNIALIFLTNDDFSKLEFLLDYVNTTFDIGNVTFCLMKLSGKGVNAAAPLIKRWRQRITDNEFDIDELKRKDFILMLDNAYETLTKVSIR